MRKKTRTSGTLLLGLGNPILGDDGVGCALVDRIHEIIGDAEGLRMVTASVSPVRLVDLITEYDRLIVVDSITTGRAETGELLEIDFTGREFSPPSAHHFSIHQIPDIAAALGLPCPSTIRVYGIEIIPATEYCDTLSIELEEKLPLLAEEIIKRELKEFTSNDNTPRGELVV